MARAPTIAGTGKVFRNKVIAIPAGKIDIKERYLKVRQDVVVTIRQNTRLRVDGTIPSLDASLKPGDITNFQATAASATEVVLTWTPPSAGGLISSIELNRRTPPTTGTYGGNLLTEPTAALTAFNDTTTVASTQYQYRIRGVSGTSNGDYTNDTVTTPPDTVTVGKPINFVAVRVSNTGIDLSWAAGPGNAPTSYELDRSLNGTSGWLNVLSGLQTSFQHRGLNPNTTYYYRVRALVGAVPSTYATTSRSTALDNFPTPKKSPAHQPWRHGTANMPLPSGFSQWETWMNHEMDLYSGFTGEAGAETWAEFRAGGSPSFQLALDNIPNDIALMHVWPPFAKSEPFAPRGNAHFAHPEIWTMLADGEFDSHWNVAMDNMLQRVQNAGRNPNTMMFRLAHEMSGEHYPWTVSVSTLPDFKAGWEHVVTDFIHTRFPGALIMFEPVRRRAGENNAISLENLLPPDHTWDVMGRSLHDVPPNYTPNFAQFDAWHIHPNPNAFYGLQTVADTVRAHGKKMGFSEWSSPITPCGQDEPPAPNNTWIANFYQYCRDFMVANADIMLWDTHFSTSCTLLYSAARQSHPASIRFKQLWGTP